MAKASTNEIRERVERAKTELAAGNRTAAKFYAVTALIPLGMNKDDARKLSAEMAIERAEWRLSPQCADCGRRVVMAVEDLSHIKGEVRCYACGMKKRLGMRRIK
ncbi:MAG: hypothetical protein V3S43_03515 [Acidimicrobiia bacterium]